MQPIDRSILDLLQHQFPVSVTPFLEIAKKLGMREQELISRIQQLKNDGIVRQISPIFDSTKLGYQSTLAAFKVASGSIDNVAARLNQNPGVSHNYLRNGCFNIWFTLTLPQKYNLRDQVAFLASESGVCEWLYLPSLRTFTIDFRLQMNDDFKSKRFTEPILPASNSRASSVEIDRAFVRELQKDLPLVSHPFLAASQKLKMSEPQIVEKLKTYTETGVVRRVAAILRPVQAGFSSNVMVAWAPAEDKIGALGTFAASLPQVSHCYQRLKSKLWPYSVYTMIHGSREDECRDVISKINRKFGSIRYNELVTLREFKKIRVRYF
ncbi:AsnC family transcriptional regulator [Chitinispirillales bacterium ANBcel5]|uniref:siroheme decarboxylase subunit alpha n=1 Tax=Cellulosispirillum alkaliphilum TaxID=3039283 RepID=UPI002A4E8F10|nr:AsnC family transcriptional regulator [Chitinispirillales bacterium ANBcel5]